MSQLCSSTGFRAVRAEPVTFTQSILRVRFVYYTKLPSGIVEARDGKIIVKNTVNEAQGCPDQSFIATYVFHYFLNFQIFSYIYILPSSNFVNPSCGLRNCIYAALKRLLFLLIRTLLSVI
jgi:hypothetical protein